MKAMVSITLLLTAAVALLVAAPGFSALPNFTVSQMDHWDFTAFSVVWNLNPAENKNISPDRPVADIMQQAFDTWTNAPNSSLQGQVPRGPDSSLTAETTSPRSLNLICFVCADADFTKDAKTLAVTITTTADAVGQSDGHGGTTRFVGQIIKADIVFNPATKFSTGPSSTEQDLQTVATHEVGHFFGLDHTGVVRAIMFPAASSLQTLTWDDVAGISLLYPKKAPDVPTATISGTVRFPNSGGVFGAHVYAESVTDTQAFGASIRKSPVGTLSRPDGTYTINGLPQDSYIITAEPLDGPVNNSDVSGYPKAFGQSGVNTNFNTRWH